MANRSRNCKKCGSANISISFEDEVETVVTCTDCLAQTAYPKEEGKEGEIINVWPADVRRKNILGNRNAFWK